MLTIELLYELRTDDRHATAEMGLFSVFCEKFEEIDDAQ